LTGVVLCLATLPARPPWVLRPPWRIEGAMDATAFRSGAELVGTSGLYKAKAVAVVQERNVGNQEALRVFIRPPWHALAMQWMAHLPYEMSIFVWKMLIVLACILFVFLWPGNRSLAALAMSWSLPAVAAIEQGQDTPWFLVCVAAAYILLRRNLDMGAGLVLSLCTIKFHFLVFLPIVIFAQKKWKLALGLSMGIIFLITVSFIAQGFSWPLDYYVLLTDKQTYPLSWIMPSVLGVIWGLPMSEVLYCSFILVTTACIWKISKLWPLETALSACFAGAILISPHAYIQDAMLFMPIALNIIALKKGFRWLAVWILSPIAAYPLAWWMPFIGPALFVLPAYVLLIRLAGETETPSLKGGQ